MNKEVQSIIRNLQNILEGEPWYGRPMYPILNSIDPTSVYKKPKGKAHSLIELLYHMITWAEFTIKQLEKDKNMDLNAFEEMDWRIIDPYIHTWANGVQQLRAAHDSIIALLQNKEDIFLQEIVEERQYNFRFLLNGLIQHNIYHLGQIAYIKSLFP